MPKKKTRKLLAAEYLKSEINITEAVNTQNACLNATTKEDLFSAVNVTNSFIETVSHPFTEYIFLKMMKIYFYVISVSTAVILIYLRAMNCSKLY